MNMMADKKHNTLGGHGASQLCAYVRRVERLEAEVTVLNTDKSEVYAEAKAAGFCKKTMRKLIQRRRKDTSDLQEEDAMLDLYEAAVVTIEKEVDPLA